MDLVYKGLELSSGGQREHRHDKVVEQLRTWKQPVTPQGVEIGPTFARLKVVPQNQTDVHKVRKKAENLLYLSLVSDLLGVISMIASYYTQENSTLLFNNLSEVIHQRCDGLKINIQLKILHATVELPQTITSLG